MTSRKKISCPICGKPDTWHVENPYRPFCTDRCKLIDLGEWASESRKIPGPPAAPEFPEADDDDHY
ncbi:DNA gyrase inhibitor YacG [Legionella sp. CNM-4043-24]|uniref:DNA gyrase inhibitor YacG n=1 Tax=Legionella sp. CNM-4043-24 TaxID=3421646 RepID=UPI00403A95DB